MPSSWRRPLSGGCRSSPHPSRLHPQTMILRWLRLPGRRGLPPPKALTLVKRRASTRASSRSLRRVAIATGSTFATSPNRRVSCAAASPRTHTISDLPSPVRSAARSAMSSRSHSVADIIAPCIAHVTSARGGGRPALTRSRSPAGSGGRRAEWDSGGLNERHLLGCMQLPHILTPRTRKSTRPQRRKKKPACRIFPLSKASAAGCSRIVTMWRPTEPAEDVSDPAGIDLQNKRRRSRRRAWRDGLADQTVVTTLEHVRSYRAFELTLIGNIDPRSVIELALVHRLASLLWRLRRASAIETGLFEIQGELLSARGQAPSREPSQPGTLGTPTLANGHSKGPGSNGRDDPPMSDHDNSLSTTMRAVPGRLSKSRTVAQCFLRLSNLDPTLLDRASSYEARLWRQSAQTIWTLDAMRRPPPPPTRRPFRKPVTRFYWDAEK